MFEISKHEGLVIENLEQQITRLLSELSALKAERDKFNEEAKMWAEKRDELHEEIRKIRQEAKNLKDKRDSLHNEIKFFKTMREERIKKRSETLELLKSQRQKIKGMLATKTGRSSKFLEDEIARIDWKIQTEPHSLEEERKLVAQVKTLEAQLQVHKQIEHTNTELDKLKKEIQMLKDEIQTDSSKIHELAEKSQKFHENMMEELEKAKDFQTKADEMHRKYVETKEKANAVHLKCAEMSEQIKNLRTAIQQKEEKERKKQQLDLKKKIENDALEKLKKGKKLSFDEFKILAEQGKI